MRTTRIPVYRSEAALPQRRLLALASLLALLFVLDSSWADPSAEITSPTNSATLTEGTVVAISATASSAGATVTSVVFFADSTTLGNDESAPYQYNWGPVSPTGQYSLTAVAWDDNGLAATSTAVSVTVVPWFAHTAEKAPTNSTGGACRWVDCNLDGRLDLAIAYETNVTAWGGIYTNSGTDFVDSGANLLDQHGAHMAWGDYDNDGDMDAVVIDSGETRVYRNDACAFTDIGAGLPRAYGGRAAWGDCDNDGDLDIALTGSIGWTDIYRNDAGSFVALQAGLLPMGYGSCVTWGDYDGDGDLDLAAAGWASGHTTSHCNIYRNDGDGVFTNIAAGLSGITHASLTWSDFDSDGDLDLLAGGQGATTLYRNDGGTFADSGATLPVCMSGRPAFAWADYDGDGDPDLAFAGSIDLTNRSIVCRNDGGGTFTPTVLPLEGIAYGEAAWGDYDRDGDVDLSLTGSGGNSVYRNDGSASNTPPASPTGLLFSPDGSTIHLTWTTASDAETPTAALTYNVRMGKTGAPHAVISGMADSVSGSRYIPASGNAQHSLALSVREVSAGQYSWSVQTIDAGYATSPWASDDVISLDPFIEIVSAHGTPVPSGGVHTNAYGLTVTNRVSSIESAGTTQHLCTGWIMTGNSPTVGTTNECIMTHTNHAELTWTWQTNYWLNLSHGTDGTLSTTSAWYVAGSSTTITATPTAGHHFAGWTGDVLSGDAYDNPLLVAMNGARSIGAVFAADVGPSWWYTTGVVDLGAQTNDYAAANLGQLKWIATCAHSAASESTSWSASGPEETVITNLISTFPTGSNHAAANLGQIKAVAQPFYNWLGAKAGQTNYPWTAAASTNDFGVANIGQLKCTFSFSIP